MNSIRLNCYIFIFILFIANTCVYAAPTGLTLGLGLGGQYINDYRGSKETQFEVIPFPYIRYEKGFLKVDKQGARGRLFKSDRVELNLSADLALSGDSEDNTLRRDMPELDTALQIGPSLNINLTGSDFSQGWSLRVPLRSVVTLSSKGIEPIGYNFAPKFTFRFKELSGWSLKTDFGAMYGSQKLHDYYYSVESQFVTTQREQYKAQAGFSGVFTKMSATRSSAGWFYGVSVRYDNLSEAAFIDSPLVETNDHLVISLAFAKIFYNR